MPTIARCMCGWVEGSCEYCAQFVLAVGRLAPGKSDIMGGRIILGVVEEALRDLESGRSAECARILEQLLEKAGMREPGPGTPRPRPGGARQVPDGAA